MGGGRAYWTENGTVNDKVFETVAGRSRFTSVLTNLGPSMYAKDICFRSYAVLSCDTAVYSMPSMKIWLSVNPAGGVSVIFMGS